MALAHAARVLPSKNERPSLTLGPCRNSLIYKEDFGAGEGIRTLDPNLGKVMLYP